MGTHGATMTQVDPFAFCQLRAATLKPAPPIRRHSDLRMVP